MTEFGRQYLEIWLRGRTLLNASLDVKTICETSVDALCNLLGYHHVSIYFVRNDTLEMQVQRGYDSPLRVLRLDRGIIGRAARTREVVFLPDVDREPGYSAALPNVQSEIALPCGWASACWAC